MPVAKRNSDNVGTKIKLAVALFRIDDIESVGNAGFHVGDFKIKPLVMVIAVAVGVEYQVVFEITNLHKNKISNYHRCLYKVLLYNRIQEFHLFLFKKKWYNLLYIYVAVRFHELP